MKVDGSNPVPIARLLDTIDPVDFKIDALDATTTGLLPVEKLLVTPPVKTVKSLYFPDLKNEAVN